MSRELEPIAVIDIGSNSVRLVVYDGAIRAPTPRFNEKILCGLGRTLASDGRLPPDSMEQAITALVRFRALMRQHKVKNVRAIATAAVRDASNGDSFISMASEAIGQDIQILTGEHEALLGANGVRMGFADPAGVVGDLGGGSLELIRIQGNQEQEWATLPIGGLQLMDLARQKLSKAGAIVDRTLDTIPWIGAQTDQVFYPIGGTWRSIARLHMELRGYPLHVMHGYTLAAKEIGDYCSQLRKAASRTGSYEGQDFISKPRRELVPYGALVMERLLARVKPSRVQFSVYGIREGLIYSLISPLERARDPLLDICGDMAARFSRDPAHAEELKPWMDPIFSAGVVEETAEEERLRAAACLISDIGWRAHPDYRAEQSLNTVAHFGLSGIDHPGRIYLAMSIFFRSNGLGDPAGNTVPARLREVLGPRLLERARIMAGAVRVAHMLSAGMCGVLPETRLAVEDGTLKLYLPSAHAELDGDRPRRRLAALAELLQLNSAVIVEN